MWTAKKVSSDFTDGVLLIGVEYTNGIDIFTESIDMTGGNSDVLDAKINTRLGTLNQTEQFVSEINQDIAAKEVIEYVAPLVDDSGIKPMDMTP